MQALKNKRVPCAVIMVTTDKVYENREWEYGYRESDRLGGHDPYSASKAAAEIGIASWRASFCGTAKRQTTKLAIATARAGNVIGGGDWAVDRIVPDAMRALASEKTIEVRNPGATRPWQHVLEPLSGYLLLAEKLASERNIKNKYASAYNFGPNLEANRTVQDLIEEIINHWEGTWQNKQDKNAPHEANRLHLQIDRAQYHLGWEPRWDFRTTVSRTVKWYKAVEKGGCPIKNCLEDIKAYELQQ